MLKVVENLENFKNKKFFFHIPPMYQKVRESHKNENFQTLIFCYNSMCQTTVLCVLIINIILWTIMLIET